MPLPKPEIGTIDLLSTFTATNLVRTVEFTEEQERELCKWWTEQIERELTRRLTGSASEYTKSLRAAGAKV
jgi:hypothetical protein